MAPHYDRHSDLSTQSDSIASTPANDDALDDAAEALRAVEVEAAETVDISELTPSRLEQMNIDELRLVAKELDVPERGTITDKDELIRAICERI